MKDIHNTLVELIRLTATSLPEDVETALRAAVDREEPDSPARYALEVILKNTLMARRNSTPICQDTGTPLFYVQYPQGWSTIWLRDQIRRSVQEATRLVYLRPNAVNSITGENSGNNLGDENFPTVHFEEVEGGMLTVDLILKGGGCENVGAQYKLPDDHLGAGRNLEGVRRAALDAVFQAQGRGCAPGVLGIAIGGDRSFSYAASKAVFLRKMNESNPDPVLAELEQRITEDANQLGIGPMGFGGRVSILGTKIVGLYRLPASYFVTISYMCWAYRRRRMVLKGDLAIFE